MRMKCVLCDEKTIKEQKTYVTRCLSEDPNRNIYVHVACWEAKLKEQLNQKEKTVEPKTK